MPHKLLFVGDVVLQSSPVLSQDLQALIREQDICCCNVEAPLSGFGAAVKKTGPLINQLAQSAEWLQDFGFNMFAMANNHILDYGAEGLAHTRQAFGANVIGAGSEEEAYALLVKEVEGVRYGFVAYGENGFGALNGDRDYGHAWVNSTRVDEDLIAYKDQVDILIVQVHAGVEMVDVPIPEWRQRYRELIDRGADMVIAHHPHVVQGHETYRGKRIFYSLGNFYFDGISKTTAWNTGGALQLVVDRKQIVQADLFLVSKQGNRLSLMPRMETEQQLARLNEKLQHTAAYENYVDQIAVEQWLQHHRNYYAKPFNGLVQYSLKALAKHIKRLLFHRNIDYDLLWHNMEIESNFWIVRRAIQKLRKKQ
ncbi:CapA family protein [Sphingobacterium griseoflavum]|uniref:Capsule synthesis protein CapA domain-containing protein n=1 Tax=Sphingobacterium griseoflavum TaxID=1474952 RepID=A0ABQ3HYK4_9SPHI|nr:CapA family protein [Sphingobacterium griseoflavum]GHE46485.1 hypothetical protein GCM10017764_32120 [Sphingobacterium griseoflavum]